MSHYKALVLLALVQFVLSDVYLHAPRGSNDRLDDNNRDRNNADRLFDSQNNNRGGYNNGNIYYYAGSVVPMEWTQQHSCGSSNNNCEIIIQYMCDPLLRDGTVTNTIPTDPTQCIDFNCDTDVRFGRQESFAYYKTCQNTKRNVGVWASAQNLNNRPDARFTRQNPNGNRRGYECPEERDYYPYWRPSPWMDIAILTNQPQRCAAYQAESQNVVGRYYCSVPPNWVTMMTSRGMSGFIPITQAECEAISYYDPMYNQTKFGTWMYSPPFGLPAPECREAQWSRDNHLGNVPGSNGQHASFNWTIDPKNVVISERCAMRLRYNISTNDFNHFSGNTRFAGLTNGVVDGDITRVDSVDLNWRNNSGFNKDPNYDPANINTTYTYYGLTYAENAASFDPTKNRNTATLKASREYVLKDYPNVNIFGSLLPSISMKFQLAIDTAQYGRTFQDRTHRFGIRTPPTGITGTIHNVQVRGKRGNIVQVYPGVEYDFFPASMNVKLGDYVHFQWTGSNNNPQNNDGQGTAGTDRSNIVELRPAVYNECVDISGQPSTTACATNPTTYGQFGRAYPVRNIDTNPFLGFSHDQLRHLAILDVNGQNGGSLEQLNDAGTYFDLGPLPVTAMGVYQYLCTRNNNFSNRNQAGTIVVSMTATRSNGIGSTGGSVVTDGATLAASAGVFGNLQLITISSTPATATSLTLDQTIVSNIITLSPFSTLEGSSATVSVPYTPYAGSMGASPQMMWSANQNGPYTEVDSTCSNNICTAQATSGGNYVLVSKVNVGAIIGVILGSAALLVLIGFCIFKPMTLRKMYLPGAENPLNQAV